MESVKLEGDIIEHKARNATLKENQVTISHEFRTPLTSSLMLLETLMSSYSLT
jgi:signal transduction histidine kinase